MEVHTEEGEWKWDDCCFQTNLFEGLAEHKALAKHADNLKPEEKFS